MQSRSSQFCTAYAGTTWGMIVMRSRYTRAATIMHIMIVAAPRGAPRPHLSGQLLGLLPLGHSTGVTCGHHTWVLRLCAAREVSGGLVTTTRSISTCARAGLCVPPTCTPSARPGACAVLTPPTSGAPAIIRTSTASPTYASAPAPRTAPPGPGLYCA
jgi:hypothetical protein